MTWYTSIAATQSSFILKYLLKHLHFVAWCAGSTGWRGSARCHWWRKWISSSRGKIFPYQASELFLVVILRFQFCCLHFLLLVEIYSTFCSRMKKKQLTRLWRQPSNSAHYQVQLFRSIKVDEYRECLRLMNVLLSRNCLWLVDDEELSFLQLVHFLWVFNPNMLARVRTLLLKANQEISLQDWLFSNKWHL